jgi:uncharacterized integral membrane protein
MGKTKSFLLLLLVILLVIFAVQNQQPAPTLKLFKFQVVTLPTFLLLYLCLVLGFALGWVAHALRSRRQRRAAASVSTEEKQESQQGQQASQGK